MASGKAIDQQDAIAAYREIIEAELSCDVIDYGDEPGLRAIHVVARSGDIELTRELLQRHANVNFCTSKGLSPLHYAVLSGSVPMIRLLLVFGAKVNAQSPRDGKTPLFTAAEKGQIAVARVLLQYGANSKLSSDTGKVPKDVAIERGDTDFVEMIEDFENRLSSVQAVRCSGNGNTSAAAASPGGKEENSNNELPPSYEEVMGQPSLFDTAPTRPKVRFRLPEVAEMDFPPEGVTEASEDEEEEEDDDEQDDTTALLGS